MPLGINGADTAICPPRARGACPARGQYPQTNARRRLKRRFNCFGDEPKQNESPKARGQNPIDLPEDRSIY
ncbi:hypothetical protein, partial [uncultured Rikenella sp.]|uniref:hypothetical protein n=1 Tax=uncultured Rikenella sp. TaxID=368003 RepID=UPI00262DF152